MCLCNLDKLGLKIFSLIFKKVHSSGSPERMCRLGGQPWFPEEVKVNNKRDKVQNLSARQPPVSFSTLGAASWISLSRELWWNLSSRFPLCQISMWFSSSQSCRSMGFFSDSFFFSHIVKWKEARHVRKVQRHCGPWELRNTGSFLHAHRTRASIPPRKNNLRCFAIHSHCVSFAEVAKQRCWLWEAKPGTRGRTQAPLTSSQQRHYFLSLISP